MLQQIIKMLPLYLIVLLLEVAYAGKSEFKYPYFYPKVAGLNQKIGECEPLTVELCMGLGYSKTKFPNLSGMMTQQEVNQEMEIYKPIIGSTCSKNLRLVLCSYYAPMCEDDHLLTEPVVKPGPIESIHRKISGNPESSYTQYRPILYRYTNADEISEYTNNRHSLMPENREVDNTYVGDDKIKGSHFNPTAVKKSENLGEQMEYSKISRSCEKLCYEVEKSCSFTMLKTLGLDWRQKLPCSSFSKLNMPDSLCRASMEPEPPMDDQIQTEIQHQNYATPGKSSPISSGKLNPDELTENPHLPNRSFWDGVFAPKKKCLPPLHYTPQDKEFAAVSIAIFSVICVGATLFGIVSYIL